MSLCSKKRVVPRPLDPFFSRTDHLTALQTVFAARPVHNSIDEEVFITAGGKSSGATLNYAGYVAATDVTSHAGIDYDQEALEALKKAMKKEEEDAKKEELEKKETEKREARESKALEKEAAKQAAADAKAATAAARAEKRKAAAAERAAEKAAEKAATKAGKRPVLAEGAEQPPPAKVPNVATRSRGGGPSSLDGEDSPKKRSRR